MIAATALRPLAARTSKDSSCPDSNSRFEVWNSVHVCEIGEDDAGGIVDGGVVAGESEATGVATYLEDGDVVAALIATIEK
jgi:hypothetical protein